MRLLLGDDHRMFLEALESGLVHRGHEVVGAYDEPDDLVDAVVRDRPDLCMLDLDFAGRSVLPAAAAIRASEPHVRLVLLAGSAPTEVWDFWDRGLVDGIVNKVCDISVLARVLTRVACGERVVERFARPSMSGPVSLTSVGLSLPERQVLIMLVEGASTIEIARALDVTHQTARRLIQNVLRKLGVSSRNKAAQLGLRLGLGSDASFLTAASDAG